MPTHLSKLSVPIGSFVLAVLLAWLGGPSRNVHSLRAAAEPSGSCSVEITGPDIVCQGDRADYKAKGMPDGATYEWTITGDDGAKIAFAKGPDAQVKVDPPAKSFTLHVTYKFDSNRSCMAAKSVTINDVLIVPICLKRLYNSKGKGTKATPEEIAKQLELANEIWKKCCIRFEPERNPDGSTKIEDVNTPKADDGLANSIEVNIVDNKADSPEFRKVLGLTKQDKCIPVWFVKNMTKVQGLTTSPTYPPNGPPTGLDPFGSGVDDHADASTLAHELGHDLGLHHVKNDKKNLMTDSGADGRDITPEQCADAYKNAKRLLDALKGP